MNSLLQRTWKFLGIEVEKDGKQEKCETLDNILSYRHLLDEGKITVNQWVDWNCLIMVEYRLEDTIRKKCYALIPGTENPVEDTFDAATWELITIGATQIRLVGYKHTMNQFGYPIFELTPETKQLLAKNSEGTAVLREILRYVKYGCGVPPYLEK